MDLGAIKVEDGAIVYLMGQFKAGGVLLLLFAEFEIGFKIEGDCPWIPGTQRGEDGGDG